MKKSPTWLFLVLALLLALTYMQSMLTYTNSEWILPLDDTYIYLQYARQFAEGHFWQYNTGDLPSTGTTSQLYPFFLTIGYLIGFRGEAFPIFVFWFNAVLLWISLMLCYRLFRRCFSQSVAIASAGLIAFTGHITWGYFLGMEIGMMIVIFLLMAHSWMRETERGTLTWTPVLLGLLILARPEGMMYSIILIGLVFLLQWRSLSGQSKIRLALPLLVVVGVLVLNYSLTGHLGPNTARPKSPWYTPYLSIPFIAQHATNFLIFVIKGLFSGSFTENILGTRNRIDMFAIVPPLSLLFFMFGSVPAVVRELQERRIGLHVLLNLWLGAGVCLVGVLSGGGYHDFRYLVPFFPIYVAYLIPGVRTLALSVAHASQLFTPRQIALGLTAYLFGFQALTTVNFVLHYGQMSYSFLEYKDAALWTKEHTEPDARIAVLDAGIMAYYGERYIYDLYGLVTNEMTDNTFYVTTGMGSKYEFLENLPDAQRPNYFFSHRIRFEDGGSEGLYAFFKQQPVYRVTPRATQYPRIGDDLSVYRLDWKHQADPNRLYDQQLQEKTRALEMIAELDVADLRSQAACRYEVLPLIPDGFAKNRPLGITYASGEFISDGALFIEGGERFRVSFDPKKRVLLVLRTANMDAPGAMAIVNGQPVGLFSADASPQQWAEVSVWLPPEFLHSGENVIEVVGTYISAHYWLFQ